MKPVAEPWSRADILSLLQLITTILVAIVNFIWHLIIQGRKCSNARLAPYVQRSNYILSASFGPVRQLNQVRYAQSIPGFSAGLFSARFERLVVTMERVRLELMLIY